MNTPLNYSVTIPAGRLTVTKVVFELSICHKAQREGHRLTVTKVVFESSIIFYIYIITRMINSNKGCF